MSEKIKKFISRWKNKGHEKQDTQTFWIELLTDVLGVEEATKRIDFEKTVKIKGDDGREHTKFIDGYIPETKVLIEQKDSKLSLKKAYSMSGTNRKYTPYEQGDRYGRHLNQKEVPRYIIASNFKEFEIHDNNHRGEEPQIIKLEDLEQEYSRLSFLVSNKNEHLEREKELSVQAGNLVGRIYEAFLKMYNDPDEKLTLESLNILIVRLVFILYAEDAGIFQKQQFLHYMEQYRDNPGVFRRELLALFDILDTPYNDRDPYIEEELKEFPYVNGGLFSKSIKIIVPTLNKEIINLILDKAAAGFDWKGISPTIFGATFESTLNPETRYSGGMHYTSLENIHKVIDPLFLDDLKSDLERIEKIENVGSRVNALNRFIERISNLKFLDPACGSGNFLTETYLELRRLENRALSIIQKGQAKFADIKLLDPIKVKLDQFYGIEINDFAVAVANTALFISEYQTLKETEAIINMRIDYLPLHSFKGIHEGNALQMNWNEVLPAHDCNYVMGNPPFKGSKKRSELQRKDVQRVLGSFNNYGNLDYVACWVKLASDYITDTDIQVAFVLTNSLKQGEEAFSLWGPLFKDGVVINFAYLDFVWNNQAPVKAHVHCVIIGFSKNRFKENKYIYSEEGYKIVSSINEYLKEGPPLLLKRRLKPISSAPKVIMGPMSLSGNTLILTPEEKAEMIEADNRCSQWIRKFSMGKEFIYNEERYCLWLEGISPHELNNIIPIKRRVEMCRKYRYSQKPSGDAYKYRDQPHLFRPSKNFIAGKPFLAIPQTSTKNRRYIPIGFIDGTLIPGQKLYIIPDASLYQFAVLTSSIHNSWMRLVSGRMKSDYSYSIYVVYNNFPWPTPTKDQKEKIEKTAQAILDIRAKYPDSSLADLYDEISMPDDLRKAHQDNDQAVAEAYGWDYKKMNEEEILIKLTRLYKELDK